jgi:hypothetical protein
VLDESVHRFWPVWREAKDANASERTRMAMTARDELAASGAPRTVVGAAVLMVAIGVYSVDLSKLGGLASLVGVWRLLAPMLFVLALTPDRRVIRFLESGSLGACIHAIGWLTVLQLADGPCPDPGTVGRLWLVLTAGLAGVGTWVCSQYRRAEKQPANG